MITVDTLMFTTKQIIICRYIIMIIQLIKKKLSDVTI